MTFLLRPTHWLVVAALACVAALGFVHILEANGYIPCDLCLRQREVYWIAGWIAVAGFIGGRWGSTAPQLAVALVGVVFLAGAGLAAYHAGVEWKWWPGPTACTGSNAGAAVAASQVADMLSGKTKLHMVRCDEAAIRVLGLSLSGWNALASAVLACLSFTVAARAVRRPA